MIDLSKFELFDFSEGIPYVTFTSAGVTFNKGVVTRLHYTNYVRILLNDADKQIAVQECDASDKCAKLFYRNKKTNLSYVRFNAQSLNVKISELCGWDLTANSYRAQGTFDPEKKLVLFDLSKAVKLS